MSTRGLYTFKGSNGDQDWNVYKHSDNYPTGAAQTLAVAQAWFAWKAPRYESDEFACAFIAAAKARFLDLTEIDKRILKDCQPGGKYSDYNGGGVRLMPQGDPKTIGCEYCCDIEYRYEISAGNDGALRIAAYSVSYWEADSATEDMIINCPLTEFPAKAAEYEKKEQEAA